MKQAIVCDIDGTLANGASLNEVLSHILRHKGSMYRLILLSYRKEHRRDATLKFLSKHGIGYNELILRPEMSTLSPAQFKLDVYNKLLSPKYEVVLAIDDNPEIIAMWKLINVQAWQVSW